MCYLFTCPLPIHASNFFGYYSLYWYNPRPLLTHHSSLKFVYFLVCLFNSDFTDWHNRVTSPTTPTASARWLLMYICQCHWWTSTSHHWRNEHGLLLAPWVVVDESHPRTARTRACCDRRSWASRSRRKRRRCASTGMATTSSRGWSTLFHRRDSEPSKRCCVNSPRARYVIKMCCPKECDVSSL